AAVEINGGEIEAAGNVVVESLYNTKGNNSEALIGEKETNGLAVAGSVIQVFYTMAESLVTNSADVKGSGKLKGKRLKVNAKADAKAEAYTGNPSSIALYSTFVIAANALARANNSANVSGKDSSGRLELIMSDDDGEGRSHNLETLDQDTDISNHIDKFDDDSTIGDILVNAVSTGFAKSQSISPLSASLMDISVGSVEAVVGGKKLEKGSDGTFKNNHSTQATLGNYLNVTKAGHVIVNADNKSEAIGRLLSGLVLNGINVSVCHVPAYIYDVTQAKITDSANINAYGSVAVLAEDRLNADTLVDGSSAGIAVNADVKYAVNTINQLVKADISEFVSIRAKEGILIQTNGNVTSKADTNANSYGIFSGGGVKAYNNIYRQSTVIIAANAKLFADYKDIIIQALSGDEDQITTLARGSGGGLLGIGDLKAETNIESHTDVHIGSGTEIENIFNKVVIGAVGSINYSRSSGDYTAGGAVAIPTMRVFNASLTLPIQVTLIDTKIKAGRIKLGINANKYKLDYGCGIATIEGGKP
ncbi:MAG: hypothetical protein HUJ75_03440, partial [Parasporobacterium sp.]|nr:hypothetical protein [Parasporobacterium sp.]